MFVTNAARRAVVGVMRLEAFVEALQPNAFAVERGWLWGSFHKREAVFYKNALGSEVILRGLGGKA